MASTSIYQLKYLQSSNEKDVVPLMRLYSENMSPDIKTDPREILHWIDKSNEYIKLFGFYRNKKLIGYTQIAYLIKSNLLFADYIVIEKNSYERVFCEFVSSVKDYYTDLDMNVNYILTEVPYFTHSKTPSMRAIALIRKLKGMNFKVIKANYFQPELGKNKESCMQAVLLLFSNNSEVKEIKKETYLGIVNSIYYEHYYKWYSEFLDNRDMLLYKEMLDDLYSRISKNLSNKKFICLNGYSHLMTNSEPNDSGYDEISSWKKNLLLFILFILLTTCILISFTFVSKMINMKADFLFYAASFAITILSVMITRKIGHRFLFLLKKK